MNKLYGIIFVLIAMFAVGKVMSATNGISEVTSDRASNQNSQVFEDDDTTVSRPDSNPETFLPGLFPPPPPPSPKGG